MQVFVARQPIFDRMRRVIAYELLFRSGLENVFKATDGDMASQSVISSGIHVFGFSSLTGGKPAFINFTKQLLLSGVALVLPLLYSQAVLWTDQLFHSTLPSLMP
ncbi:MAG: hypothetical protein ACK40X_02075 [Armatimonadota bacterium]